MKPPSKPAHRSVRRTDLLWHIGKTLLCLLQFFVATGMARETVLSLANAFLDDAQTNVIYWIILLAAQGILFHFLWNYYDDIDDRSFDRFCEPEEPPSFFRDPAYLVGLILTTLGGGICFLAALHPLLRILLFLVMDVVPDGVILAGSSLPAILAAGGLSILRLRRRHYIWSVQKTLRQPTDKRPSPPRRVLFALIFAVAFLLSAVLLTSVVPLLLRFVISLLLISKGIFIAVAAIIAAVLLFFLLRRIGDRRRFFRRLNRLRDRGELSYTVHGSPYLSLFFHRVAFSLTVEDEPHPDSRVRTPTTYRIAVANCNRRRMTVVLCEDNRFQFMYDFSLRVLGSARTLSPGTGLLSIPIGAFFITRDFDFPEGEGKRILLVDPAPHRLCMRGFKEGQFIQLDNASAVFGYTVYGKNAFLSLLERI